MKEAAPTEIFTTGQQGDLGVSWTAEALNDLALPMMV